MDHRSSQRSAAGLHPHADKEPLREVLIHCSWRYAHEIRSADNLSRARGIGFRAIRINLQVLRVKCEG